MKRAHTQSLTHLHIDTRHDYGPTWRCQMKSTPTYSLRCEKCEIQRATFCGFRGRL